MKKEEILEKSRKENNKKDIYAIEVETKACKYASVAMLILATVYYIYEICSGKGTNPALYSIITVYCTILYAFKAIKISSRRKLNIFTASIWGILTIMLFLQYFKVI